MSWSNNVQSSQSCFLFQIQRKKNLILPLWKLGLGMPLAQFAGQQPRQNLRILFCRWFYKRLSNVFDDEFEAQVEQFGDAELAHEIIEQDHADALKMGRKGIVRFYILRQYSWQEFRSVRDDEKSIG